MRLRKILIAGAAAVAASVLGFTATAAHAGAPITAVEVNGDSTPGTHAIQGTYVSGSASFAGGTYNCVDGSADGIVRSGPRPLPAGESTFEFPVLDITCETPVGGDAEISVDTGCLVTVDEDLPGDVNPGIVDSVPSTAVMPDDCVEISALGGACTANAEGSLVGGATYDEANQRLILDGAGLQLENQSIGCLGLLTGSFDLNNITFDMTVAGGNNPGVDFL